MTEPRTPDERTKDPEGTPSIADAPTPTSEAGSAATGADSPTQAWPSMATPGSSEPAASDPVAAAAEAPDTAAAEAPDTAAAEAPDTAAAEAPAADAATPADPLADAPIVRPSPYEPAETLPATRVGSVGETGTFDAGGQPGASRSKLRWGLALIGVLIVAAGSFLIVSLVGGRPSTSVAMGYMPAATFSYNEVRIDLPGDQRQKLAAFLQKFPGFADQSAIEPKIDELFDRIVRAASKDKQTWTADIKPWFGGQIAVGVGLPSDTASSTVGMSGMNNSLVAVTIVDRAKAIDWVTRTGDRATINRTTYGDADLLLPAGGGEWAIAVNDKVMIAGTAVGVKAAMDTGGKGTFDQNDDVKAALATLDQDYVMFGVTRTRQYADAAVRLFAVSQPGVLERSQIDETVLAMVPAWQAMTARFENDAVVATTVGPSWSIGFDSTNRASQVVGHVPAKTVLYTDIHDLGPNLSAILAKFRALEEAKPAFTQLDQALSLLGGADAVYGWWGDAAIVVSALADGTIGGGLVIHPQDAAKADRLLTTLSGFLALGGSSAGVTTRTEDHNGTKITIVDLSGASGMSTTDLPPGYKAELAWASNADVAVMGYGSTFVKEVLDAGPGTSLGDDARFKGFLGRVGAENLGVTFVDVAAIRALIEPLAQGEAPAAAWSYYTKEIQPYLAPLDAVISGIRKDNGLDRGTGALTVH